MSFDFVGPSGSTLTLPKTEGQSVEFTMGDTVRITAQTDYETKAKQYTKKGRLKVQWVLEGTDQNDEDVRMYVAKSGLKDAFGTAMRKNKINGFFVGDTITITYKGKEKAPNSSFQRDAYEVVINHTSNEQAEVIDTTSEEQEASQQVQQGYSAQPPAPQQNYNPGVQQGYGAPQGGYGQTPPNGYPQQGQAPVPPQGAPVPNGFQQGTSDQNPWG